MNLKGKKGRYTAAEVLELRVLDATYVVEAVDVASTIAIPVTQFVPSLDASIVNTPFPAEWPEQVNTADTCSRIETSRAVPVVSAVAALIPVAAPLKLSVY